MEPARRRPARPTLGLGQQRPRQHQPHHRPGRPLHVDSDKATVYAVEQIATDRSVRMAAVASAWVLRNPVVDAPIVGATKAHHLTDAVAALDIDLTDDEANRLEHAYTPRLPTCYS